jgi:dephospho-CoA kinase
VEAAPARVPFVIGVTGNIACGKSTVMRMLAELGAETIDADALYHELIAPGGPLVTRIRERFGESVVDSAHGIDRKALGQIVFADPSALRDLERITHPAVVAAAKARIAGSRHAVAAIDAVKLVESGLIDSCDQLWLVTCDPDVQRARLIARGGLSEADADRRLAAQPPVATKTAIANVRIDNSGAIERTRGQVLAAWASLPILSH